MLDSLNWVRAAIENAVLRGTTSAQNLAEVRDAETNFLLEPADDILDGFEGITLTRPMPADHVWMNVIQEPRETGRNHEEVVEQTNGAENEHWDQIDWGENVRNAGYRDPLLQHRYAPITKQANEQDR
jgi:hypothetical protein